MIDDPNPYEAGRASNVAQVETSPRLAWLASSLAVMWTLLLFFGPPALSVSSSIPFGYLLTIKLLTSCVSLAALGVLTIWTWNQNRWVTVPSIGLLLLGQIGVWVNF